MTKCLTNGSGSGTRSDANEVRSWPTINLLAVGPIGGGGTGGRGILGRSRQQLLQKHFVILVASTTVLVCAS